MKRKKSALSSSLRVNFRGIIVKFTLMGTRGNKRGLRATCASPSVRQTSLAYPKEPPYKLHNKGEGLAALVRGDRTMQDATRTEALQRLWLLKEICRLKAAEEDIRPPPQQAK